MGRRFAALAGLLRRFPYAGRAAIVRSPPTDTSGATSLSPSIDPSFFDAAWYLSQYPDVAAAGIDAWSHFIEVGASEGRDPNRFFDSAWYAETYDDVRESGLIPFFHYIAFGAAELRRPNSRFDAKFYVKQHPDAAQNPLKHYLLHGRNLDWPTRPTFKAREHIPVVDHATPKVDIVVPVYRGTEETRRCIEGILSSLPREYDRLIVINDCSPESELTSLLEGWAAQGAIELLTNEENLGFVKSVNRGIAHASADADILLLNSDTEVPSGWIGRLVRQAHKHDRIGTVTPFSNNATICSYPSNEGGALPRAFTLAELDRAAQRANANRSVDIPTAVGFCMYIRRDCLEDVGAFDAETFGRGYGEENDFCLKASERGWKHVLACDTFVFHAGEISFGPNSKERMRAWQTLVDRYPNYPALIAEFIEDRESDPVRFALTSALYNASNKPKILIVTHTWGGGTERHVQELVQKVDAHFLILRPSRDGVELTIPGISKHPSVTLHNDDVQNLAPLLVSFGVSRIHVHQVVGFKLDILHGLLLTLGLPFDFTVHDYLAICPQIDLIGIEGKYCGEPDLADCNSCLRNKPALGSADILTWRKAHEWLVAEADRVICPSEDVRHRLDRYGLAGSAIVVPHEPVANHSWFISVPSAPSPSEPLRVALLGLIRPNKGAAILEQCAAAFAGQEVEFFVIGKVQPSLPDGVSQFVSETGAYEDEHLQDIIREVDPHVLWFPAPWPETYSYTLSAAIASGRPIVATRIGALPERLEGRPWTWVQDLCSRPGDWLETFRHVRRELGSGRWSGPSAYRQISNVQFYQDVYLAAAKPRSSTSILDTRRSGRLTAVVVAEKFAGTYNPCAYIRLIEPLTHPTVARELNIIVASAEEAKRYRADVLVTHRMAVSDLAQAEELVGHCNNLGMKLIYDLDDDLLHIEEDHSEYKKISACKPAMHRLLAAANAVFVSTATLQAKLEKWRPDVILIPNALDERIWRNSSPLSIPPDEPARILYMGTHTHGADFAIIESAARQIRDEFGEAVSLELIGVTDRTDFGDLATRIVPPAAALRSYPAFVNWFANQKRWHIGIAPLVDSEFNRGKSAIKVFDYWALRLAVVASDVPAYRDVLQNRQNGLIVANTCADWHLALRSLIVDTHLRQQLAAAGEARFIERHTLRTCGHLWLQSINSVLCATDQRSPPLSKAELEIRVQT